MLLQLLLANNLQHGLGGGHRHRVTAEGVEVRNIVTEGDQYVGFCQQPGDRDAISHRFSKCHHVRHNAVAAKAPETLSGAGKTRLYFVSNKDPAVGVHHVECRLQETLRTRQYTIGGETISPANLMPWTAMSSICFWISCAHQMPRSEASTR